MDRIKIELGMWEDAPCPICTKNVDLEKAEKLLYQSLVSNFGYTKEEVEDYITNNDYRGNGWTREWEKFQETLCAEEESIVIECGGKYYEDMSDEEYDEIHKEDTKKYVVKLLKQIGETNDELRNLFNSLSLTIGTERMCGREVMIDRETITMEQIEKFESYLDEIRTFALYV